MSKPGEIRIRYIDPAQKRQYDVEAAMAGLSLGVWAHRMIEEGRSKPAALEVKQALFDIADKGWAEAERRMHIAEERVKALTGEKA